MNKPAYNIISAAKDIIAGVDTKPLPGVVEHRLAICNACPDLKQGMNVCGICFCWVPGKVKFKDSSCPKGKW